MSARRILKALECTATTNVGASVMIAENVVAVAEPAHLATCPKVVVVVDMVSRVDPLACSITLY